MKKFLLLAMALGITLSTFAQNGGLKQIRAKNVVPALASPKSIDLPVVGVLPVNNYVSNKSINDDPVSSQTRYDMQTNSSIQNRLYLYPDGTIGTTATWSTQDASWTDRGTGYNLFDGTAFGPLPSAKVEAARTGWPSYCPFGANGELIISHQAAGNLVMNSRPVKGTGTWTQQILPNAIPTGVPAMLWARAVTNGATHTNIHIIALTEPTGNGGAIYNGMDGALMYCRSVDAGVTFSAWTQLPGITSTQYTGIGGDDYAFTVKGDTLAFVVGSGLMDEFIMKSTDNGTTWTKTIIWNSLYNLGGISPGWFNCPDASSAIALDNQGFAHVVFGLQYDSAPGGNTFYYNRTANGIAYWNEHMPMMHQSLDWDTLVRHHQIGGFLKDTNAAYWPIANMTMTNGRSLTSFSQLVIDKRDKIFLVFAGATTLADANSNDLRHVFGRDGTLSGDTVRWSNDTLVDITGDWIQYNFSECTYPSVSPTTDQNNVYILFQKDDFGGSYVGSIGASGWVGQSTPSDNFITMIKWQKPVMTSVNDKKEKPTFSISQNYPNPAAGLTKVNVYMQYSGDLSLKVTNLTGQTLMSMEKPNVLAGVNEFIIDASQLPSGIYFYTVKQGDKSVTKKMIVQ
jgi:hypothetical protein